MTIKEHKGIFLGDGNDLYFDNGGGYIGISIYQILLNCTFFKKDLRESVHKQGRGAGGRQLGQRKRVRS